MHTKLNGMTSWRKDFGLIGSEMAFCELYIKKGKLMFKIVISMKNEYCTEPKKY